MSTKIFNGLIFNKKINSLQRVLNIKRDSIDKVINEIRNELLEMIVLKVLEKDSESLSTSKIIYMIIDEFLKFQRKEKISYNINFNEHIISLYLINNKKNHKTYGYYNSNNYLFNNYINKNKFFKKYYYFDSIDKPKKIKKREWIRRSNIWDDIIKEYGFTMNKMGIHLSSFINIDNIFIKELINKIENFDKNKKIMNILIKDKFIDSEYNKTINDYSSNIKCFHDCVRKFKELDNTEKENIRKNLIAEINSFLEKNKPELIYEEKKEKVVIKREIKLNDNVFKIYEDIKLDMFDKINKELKVKNDIYADFFDDYKYYLNILIFKYNEKYYIGYQTNINFMNSDKIVNINYNNLISLNNFNLIMDIIK